jgi:uncharacterized protein DUF2188
MPRKVFHSSPTDSGWKVTYNGRTLSTHKTQKGSERAAMRAGRKAESKGGLGQAVLHKSNRGVREARKYG